jgi:hypothetical protein
VNKISKWIQDYIVAPIKYGEPNSPEGLRYRARRLVRDGFPPDNPMVTALLKQADLKEGKKVRSFEEYLREAER